MSDVSIVTPGAVPSENPAGAFATATRMPGFRCSFFASTRFTFDVLRYLQTKFAASFVLPTPLYVATCG